MTPLTAVATGSKASLIASSTLASQGQLSDGGSTARTTPAHVPMGQAP
jgi:hypothetical protein